jgi:hypothetical protein
MTRLIRFSPAFVLLALGLFLTSCGGDGSPVVTPSPTIVVTPSPTATSVPQPVTMESDVHAYSTTNYWVYFVTYQSLGRETTAKFVDVEWDCSPPDPTHNHAFFGVPVFREDDKLSYDGHTLRLAPVVPPSKPFTGVLVGTIRADGSWSMLEEDTGLHFTFKVATDTPESLVKRYDGKPCTLSK